MEEPGYPAARAVASKVLDHFTRHVTSLSPGGSEAFVPLAEYVGGMVDAAFWASLRREEGYVPELSLALVPPERVAQPLMFDRPLPLAPVPLVRIAPAVERPGIHLGVWRENGEVRVWG